MAPVKDQVGKDKDKPINRKILSLFLVMFPSLLIAGNYSTSLVANLGLKAALIFYQFVLLRSFLDNYYRLID